MMPSQGHYDKIVIALAFFRAKCEALPYRVDKSIVTLAVQDVKHKPFL